MKMQEFYQGRVFDAYEYLGAHIGEPGTVFRTFAPNAARLSIIGEFSDWKEIPMKKIYDGNFYEAFVPEAKEGMRYKIKVYGMDGRDVDHCDPYGFGMEVPPDNCSIIRNMDRYQFSDEKWMNNRTDCKNRPLNVYEVHLGSWRLKDPETGEQYTYRELADRLIPYVKERGYNYLEIMPIAEYPCDASWGYQALAFFSPTSRYGTADDLKAFVDQCHQNDIGVLLDFVPVHFAVDYFGLADFDGTALYEYPNNAVGYSEWGSKNFMHSRGEVRSFLQSAAFYWIKEYHIDGLRMDAISNMIYWQGNCQRGVNKDAVAFIQHMNQGLKIYDPSVILAAEDSTSFPDVTKPVVSGGLGFDYKWDMGWMNDTIQYFQMHPYDRMRDYHKLTFSMHYFYGENYLLPLSHDEVVHGKATILQKMYGDYEGKFPQARAFYMYMYAHPGKKLNFMGNEIGQLREWDEKKEQDWMLLKYPIHGAFYEFTKSLSHCYLNNPAFYEKDYDPSGFLWTDCHSESKCVYSFLRRSEEQTVLAVFNFSDQKQEDYEISIKDAKKAQMMLDSNWERFGGNVKEKPLKKYELEEELLMLDLEPFSAKYLLIE
ncbi:MAG: 1,4-alpha-glucan branching protein GlgB [Lachnospiraceae bacterium]